MIKFRLTPIAAALLPAFVPGFAWAGPSGGTVVAGDAGIRTPNTSTTVVTQNSQGAVINWQQFSVGSQEYVVFNQPNTTAAILNRVVGGSPSEILGQIQSNGRVLLINPNGVLFGQGSRLDVGSLTASTLDISNDDFMAARYRFAGSSDASVVNQGHITAADGGYVVLAGDSVNNSGLIQARLGDVVLASGSAVTLDVGGSGLVGYSIDAQALSERAGVTNLGSLVADGGVVVMDARVARSLIGAAVNHSGRVQAQSIDEQDGEVWLSARGGNVVSSGVIDVSGSATAADAGTVRLASDGDVTLADGARILAGGHGSGDGGDVRLIAEQTLDFSRGAGLIARGGIDGGKGGFVELSGHEEFWLAGDIDLGSGGHLLIDPDDLIVEDGYGSSSANTIYEQFIESQLQRGTDVSLAATGSITFRNLLDDQLDGREAGVGGSLYVDVTGTAGGPITFDDLDDSIMVDGSLSMNAGQAGGTINVGHLTARDIYLNGGDGISTGDLTATSEVTDDTANATASIDLSSGNGAVSTGALSVQAEAINGYARAAIYIDAATSVTTGDVSAISTGGFVDTDGDGIAEGEASFQIGNGSAPTDISLGNISIHDVVGEQSGEVISLYINGGSGTTAFGTVDTDGVVYVESTGAIETSDLDARTVVLEGGSVQAGDITTLNDVRLTAASGNIRAGTLNVSSADIFSASGDIVLRDVLSGGYVGLQSGGGISAGDVEAGGTAYISAGNGDAELGDVTLTAIDDDASLYIGSSAGSVIAGAISVSSDGGNASFSAEGNRIDLQSNVTVRGVGDVLVDLFGILSVDVAGDIVADAAAASYDYGYGGVQTTERGGTATVDITAYGGGTLAPGDLYIHTGDISVSGPNASVTLQAGNVVTGDIELLADASAYSRVDRDDTTVAESDFAIALLAILASSSDEEEPAISTGSLTVRGPSAQALLLGDGIVVDGAIDLRGTGFDISGDWNELSYLARPDLFNLFGTLNTPQLDQGTLHWGGAGLTIAGYSDTGYGGGAVLPSAGNVSTGAISIRGIGEARAHIAASSFDTNDGALLIDAYSDGPGTVLGEYSESQQIGEDFYSVRHQFDDGAGGAARYGRAEFDLYMDGGDDGDGVATLGDLSLLGYSVGANIDGGGELNLGDVALQGATGDEAPTVREHITYFSGEGGGPAIDPVEVGATGDINAFSIGFDDGDDQTFSVVTAGDIGVNGAGFAGLAIDAGSVSTGAISLSASLGRLFDSRIGLDETLGDVAVIVGGEAPAGIEGLSVNAARHAYLGVNANSSGDIDIAIGSQLVQLLPAFLLDFEHPLEVPRSFDQGDLGGALAAADDGDLALRDIQLVTTGDDADIRIRLGEDSALGNLTLNAGGTLDIDGNQARLSVADANLSGGNVHLASFTLDAGNVSIAADGADPVDGRSVELNAVGINATTLSLSAAGSANIIGSVLDATTSISLAGNGGLRIAGSNLAAAQTALVSGEGAIELAGSTINDVADPAASGTVSLVGGSVTIDDSLIGANTLSITTTQGDLHVVGGSLLSHATSGLLTSFADLTLSDALLAGAAHTLQAGGALSIFSSSISLGGDGDVRVPASSIVLNAETGLDIDNSSLAADDLSFVAGDILIVDSTVGGDLDLDSSGDTLIRHATLTGNAADLQAAGRLRFEADAYGGNSVLSYTQTLRLASSGGAVELEDSALSSGLLTLASVGDIRIVSSSLDGDVDLQGNADLLISDSSLFGASGQFLALGDIRVEDGSRLIYSGDLSITSTTGGIVVSASQLGSNPGNEFDKALGAGDISLQASLNLLLQDSRIEGETVSLNALGGDVGDGGSGSTIDASGLGVRSGGDIDFGSSSLIVGSGAAPFGGDPDVIARLDAPLRPDSTTPNASFIAPGAVNLGTLNLSGDYLFIQTDSIAFSGPISAPENLLVQLLPFDPTVTLGLENATAALRDINLNAGDHFPALARPTILIGGSGYSGNIYVGENGEISIPELTNVVFVTGGEVRNPVRINTSGQVLVLDGTVINDTDADPLQDEIDAIQNQVYRPVSYEASPEPLPEGRELIEQQTNSQTELVCR